jgi:copper transport protein
VAAWVLAGVIATLGMLATAAPASAHATLLRTDPAAGAILTDAPSEVTLTFSESVGTSLGKVTVVDPDGKAVHQGKLSQRKGAEASVKLKSGLRDGTYLVSYRVISADGHPISGGFTFSIGAPSQQAAAVTGSGSASVDPTVRGLLSLSKYAGYLGMALLAGAVLMLVALWPRRLPSTGPGRLAWIGWGLLFGGTLVSLVIQTPYSTGGTLADISWGDVVATAETTVGKAQVIRLGLLVAGSTLLWRITKAKPLGTAEWGLLSAFGVTLLITWPFSGHAWASPGRLLSIPADAIHVGAMAVWVGGLVVLARYLLPAARPSELEVILPVWSRWATYAVVALAFTGTIEALLEIGTFGALISTTYGRLVIAKVLGLGAILSVAALARAWVRQRYPVAVAHAFAEESGEQAKPAAKPETKAAKAAKAAKETKAAKAAKETKVKDEDEPADDDADGVTRLRSRVLVELALAAVVIMLATALVQTSPGRTAATTTVPDDLPFTATVTTSTLVLQIDMSPAKRGNNSMHLTAFTKEGKSLKVLEWKASIAMPAKGLESVDIPLLAITENHAIGEIQLPVSGDWKLKAIARTSDVDQVTVERNIRIR